MLRRWPSADPQQRVTATRASWRLTCQRLTARVVTEGVGVRNACSLREQQNGHPVIPLPTPNPRRGNPTRPCECCITGLALRALGCVDSGVSLLRRSSFHCYGRYTDSFALQRLENRSQTPYRNWTSGIPRVPDQVLLRMARSSDGPEVFNDFHSPTQRLQKGLSTETYPCPPAGSPPLPSLSAQRTWHFGCLVPVLTHWECRPCIRIGVRLPGPRTKPSSFLGFVRSARILTGKLLLLGQHPVFFLSNSLIVQELVRFETSSSDLPIASPNPFTI